MTLFNATRRSWQLLGSAVFVVRRYPKLLLFPVLTGIFTLIIGAFFMAPVIVVAVHHPPAPNAGPFETLGTYPRWIGLYTLLLYPLSMFAATFCNVAFYSQIISALNQGPVSIRQGLKAAATKMKSILVWSLFGGVVGGLIREIEGRLGFAGRLLIGLLGVAWGVACVFVIPIIIREEATGNPLEILKKSAATIKRTWGEMLTGYAGIGIVNVIVFASSLVVLLAGAGVAIALGALWAILVLAGLWLVAILVYGAFSSVASQAYRCALYIYASEGVIAEPYDQGLLDRAWRVKQG